MQYNEGPKAGAKVQPLTIRPKAVLYLKLAEQAHKEKRSINSLVQLILEKQYDL